jgi:tetratricopeptide (TPR) repeat protein
MRRTEVAVRIAVVIVGSLIAAACSATGPEPRPLESGFSTASGVADPYADGKKHLAAGRYEVAVQRFAQALSSDRRSLDALNGLGVAYTSLGRFDVAQTYFERALQLDPTSAATLNNYGWSLMEQGRLRDAKPFLELALEHAADTDAPVVTGNIDRIRRAQPSALVAALGSDSGRGARSGQRLLRMRSNVHRLETGTTPLGQPDTATTADHAGPADEAPGKQAAGLIFSQTDPSPEPPAMTEDVGPVGPASSSPEHGRAGEADSELPTKPRSRDAPIQLWRVPAPDAQAGPILAGDEP